LALCVLLLATTAFAAEPTTRPADSSATSQPAAIKEKVSYGIGRSIATQMMQSGLDLDTLDLDQLVLGLKEQFASVKSKYTAKEIQEAMQVMQADVMNKQAKKAAEAGEKNKKEGQAFLEANGKKEGVKTTKSGLQYKVIQEGDPRGTAPGYTDTVSVNYKGTLLDGKQFDASEEHGGPATFRVNGVIKGWTVVLQLMKPGAKYQVFIPSDL